MSKLYRMLKVVHPSARIRNIQKTAGGSSGELDKHIPEHLAMNS